jgi:hypothetical protein
MARPGVWLRAADGPVITGDGVFWTNLTGLSPGWTLNRLNFHVSCFGTWGNEDNNNIQMLNKDPEVGVAVVPTELDFSPLTWDWQDSGVVYYDAFQCVTDQYVQWTPPATQGVFRGEHRTPYSGIKAMRKADPVAGSNVWLGIWFEAADRWPEDWNVYFNYIFSLHVLLP